jgi:hypothetical protein
MFFNSNARVEVLLGDRDQTAALTPSADNLAVLLDAVLFTPMGTNRRPDLTALSSADGGDSPRPSSDGMTR